MVPSNWNQVYLDEYGRTRLWGRTCSSKAGKEPPLGLNLNPYMSSGLPNVLPLLLYVSSLPLFLAVVFLFWHT